MLKIVTSLIALMMATGCATLRERTSPAAPDDETWIYPSWPVEGKSHAEHGMTLFRPSKPQPLIRHQPAYHRQF